MALLRPLLLLCSTAGAFAAGHVDAPPQFQTSDRCFACHNGMATKSGEDVSIGLSWRATMMANSSRDPYWQAGVRREVTEHPESRAAIEDECSVCHMPMARYQAHLDGKEGEIFAHLPFDKDKDDDRLAEDGVSCSLCHQITNDKLGTPDSFVGRFVIGGLNPEGLRPEFGPYKIENGQTLVMRSSSEGFKPTESDHVRKSELCATCHTLLTKALGPKGEVIGELPEQVPYQEWLHSEYHETRSCQDCHMPVVKEDVPVTRVFGVPREKMSRHVFVGGNFFILRMLNKYSGELSVGALPTELEASVQRTVKHLQEETAHVAVDRVEVNAGRLEADVSVENLGGHKFPTAYPARRAWLHVAVVDSSNRVVFESGALQPNGSITGNDNDADAERFEPHYTEITTPDQVQIYESIMSTPEQKPTTTLLSAVGYLKDNRLLPRGFDKQTADKQVAVVGGALQDADFSGAGDHIRYAIPLNGAQGPFRVSAELLFQPISYRWASNLRPYDAFETKRFTGYYDAMAGDSTVVVAHATAASR